ncbi:dihydropteroate synthase [Desertivirga brevis]|uniref:dihydropteroate synthase n=1 Tax=Desertivirga brevis TaxID=2810310 RepID=UPI001A96B402|nr:dihydropteroate synthase [Pedobacter sp. SYSU D00873]
MSDKNTIIRKKKTINAGGTLIDFASPKVMGILNITPDSFYSGSRFTSIDTAVRRTEKMLEDGADIIDIGGYSSRPGATDISAEDEKSRLIPVIREISKRFPSAILSIDTFRAEVARAAINEGGHIINDISGGELDSEMFRTISELETPYVLMHMRGTPQDMKQHTNYEDIVREILQYFMIKATKLKEMGVKDIILDPGFGFAKTIEQNFRLVNNFEHFSILGIPVLAGISRKSMIWKTLGIKSDEALNGTTVLNTIALQKGADIVRVHDVKEAIEAAKLIEALKHTQ